MSNTIKISDDLQKGSMMVKIPKFKLSEVIEGGSEKIHPAFIVNGKEIEAIYISKYQNVVEDQRAYSLKGKDPQVFITIDDARKCCEAKGKGWHLMTNNEWAAVALLSKKKGTLPRGNNDSGKDYLFTEEKGILSENKPCPVEGKPSRVNTGSGPESWSHDGTEDGIYDLNGNVWEWIDNIRAVDGKIQERNSSNDDWCFLNSDGDLCKIEDNALRVNKIEDPDTLCLTNEKREISSEDGLMCTFKNLKNETTELLARKLKAKALLPVGKEYGEDVIAVLPKGKYNAIRGGYWVNKENAGIFSLGMILTENENYYDVGFRCAYYEE